MGARVNFVFKTDLDMPNLVLYSHWGETTWREDLVNALVAAKPRLDMSDISYATRIIIDQLTKDGRDQQTGYGIYLAHPDLDYADTVVEIDMTTQMINDNGWHSFESFVNYHWGVQPSDGDLKFWGVKK
jgi:hypothetical protein